MKKKIISLFMLLYIFAVWDVKAYTAKGYGSVESISLDSNTTYNKRCGNDKCLAVAYVKYANKSVSYYMPTQNAEGLLPNSGRLIAFTSMLNATTNKGYTPKEIQDYLISQGGDGQLMSDNIDSLIDYYGADAYVYKGELSKESFIEIVKDANTNGYPLAAIVSKTRCSDVPNVNHGILILGLDSDGYVKFIDSQGYYKTATKRTPEELSKCLTGDAAADRWGYRLLLMSFPDGESTTSLDESGITTPRDPNDLTTSTNTTPTGGSTTDPYPNMPSISIKNEFSCENVFYIKDTTGELTEKEFAKILDNIFDVLKILGPIMTVVLSIIDYIKVTSKMDASKKTTSKLIKRVFITVLIMFLPFLLDALFKFYGLFSLSRCNIG